MKIIIVIAFLLLTASLSATSFSFSNDTGKIVKVDEFQKFIDTMGLAFEMPSDYKETFVKENEDLWYGFAIKDMTADFEVRYTVWSLESAIEEFEKCKLDSNCLMVSPNEIYKGIIHANVLNMTGGQDYEIGSFPTEAVKKEFNADAGGSSFFEFNSGFGSGYKYGQMVYLHKDNIADVIITYMSNDKSSHSILMDKPFHALRFK